VILSDFDDTYVHKKYDWKKNVSMLIIIVNFTKKSNTSKLYNKRINNWGKKMSG
jgi:hypothetical protein